MAHYIAGVLDRDAMVNVLESLSCSASLKSGDLVRTLKGTLHGRITKILNDGRVKWRTETGMELIALPETLTLDD